MTFSYFSPNLSKQLVLLSPLFPFKSLFVNVEGLAENVIIYVKNVEIFPQDPVNICQTSLFTEGTQVKLVPKSHFSLCVTVKPMLQLLGGRNYTPSEPKILSVEYQDLSYENGILANCISVGAGGHDGF